MDGQLLIEHLDEAEDAADVQWTKIRAKGEIQQLLIDSDTTARLREIGGGTDGAPSISLRTSVAPSQRHLHRIQTRQARTAPDRLR